MAAGAARVPALAHGTPLPTMRIETASKRSRKAFIVLFIVAATVQAMGMRRADMGPSYIFVLGAETLASALLSVLYLHEQWSLLRIFAVFLVVLGIALLHPS